MNVAVKYLILVFAFIAGINAMQNDAATGTGIVAAGAFIAYALIESCDVKIDNEIKEEE